MENGTLNKELVDMVIALDKIYLDPNNPRFTSLKWNDVSDEHIADDGIQKITRRKLEEEFSIYKLVDNIQLNGFLSIDRVIVKRFSEDKYVVLEGNRRICAAKVIMEMYEKNNDTISEEVIDSLKEIKCLVYTGTEEQPSWVFQGLRHIIGIQEWPAYNKARLLVQLMEEDNLSLTDVGKKLVLQHMVPVNGLEDIMLLCKRRMNLITHRRLMKKYIRICKKYLVEAILFSKIG